MLVVARVVAAGVVASEVSARMSLEVARQSAEDRATTTENAAAMAATERDSLVSRLALAEAKIEKLRAATASVEEATERAKTAATATETAAWDAAQATTREKVVLKARVSELEGDLSTATTDLATTIRQFAQVANQIQVVTKEEEQLRDSNTKLLQDLDDKSDEPLCFLSGSGLASCWVLTR
jgi:capsule polysaccharide export protein KpsE/RkpR